MGEELAMARSAESCVGEWACLTIRCFLGESAIMERCGRVRSYTVNSKHCKRDKRGELCRLNFCSILFQSLSLYSVKLNGGQNGPEDWQAVGTQSRQKKQQHQTAQYGAKTRKTHRKRQTNLGLKKGLSPLIKGGECLLLCTLRRVALSWNTKENLFPKRRVLKDTENTQKHNVFLFFF
ncbi:uncharacterized protein LOC118820079 isoform X3 [Colossoma macropomum]|uniref:uncharacterized protein LOC118820079 isoform X3 n=1 Tax=Colossoma macropomum TaxID=42526 RepID=UPI00186513BB|nr:uncharacterized protein LOC118820079 isoform X3 [Colossoma macropomum]XP_036444100.1 uncharacterized protein LOC118820079 isoform X3 [Colossoma macropomum]